MSTYRLRKFKYEINGISQQEKVSEVYPLLSNAYPLSIYTVTFFMRPPQAHRERGAAYASAPPFPSMASGCMPPGSTYYRTTA